MEPMQWQFYSTKSSIEESRGVPFVREVCRAIWWCVQCPPQIAHTAVVGEGWLAAVGESTDGQKGRSVWIQWDQPSWVLKLLCVCFLQEMGGKRLNETKLKPKPKQTHAPAMMLWMMKAPEVVCARCDNQFNSWATQPRLCLKTNLFTSISCVSF